MSSIQQTNTMSRLLSYLPSYAVDNSCYDELRSSPMEMHAHWSRILTGIVGENIGFAPPKPTDEHPVTTRWQNAKKLLQDYAGGSTPDTDGRRLWDLDPIPLMIDEKDWQPLANGIAQRARLIEFILRDVYGSQTLIDRGLIPPELVYSSESYLQAMQNTVAADQPIMSIYAAQLCRDVQGKWYVMADRSQGPSGCGYSVENRIAVSRIFPEEFRELHVQRSAPFFATMRQTLGINDLSGTDSTRTVLLSPGIRSRTYFEDAYLARYLGYTLAQSDDLTVRGGEVFLKTLGGLSPVANILRRISDLDCDPLELRPSSTGIPGLCQALRGGRVMMANRLGSGWAETPALMSLLPRICKEVFGEELILPSWQTWWCGDPKSRQYVADNIDQLSIRDAFVRHSGSRLIGAHLSVEQKQRSLAQLQKDPWNTIATLDYSFSKSPCWIDSKIVACPTVMRVFATASKGNYMVQSGAIARVSESPDRLTESLASGQMSKDVWVLGDRPVAPMSLLSSQRIDIELRRSTYDLPSRVAEQMFWLGRWTERAEGMVRHARFSASRLAGESDGDAISVWASVVGALEDKPIIMGSQKPDGVELSTAMRKHLMSFVFDDENLNSLAAALTGVRRNASMIRDRLSLDSWQILSRLDLNTLFPYPEERRRLSDVQLLLNQMLVYLTAFTGLVAESMTRGPGWQFLDLGRRIERSQRQLRLIKKLIVPVQQRMTPILESLLEIMDSSMTYRYRYLMRLEIEPVLDLLMFDQTNPRGTAFQFAQLDEHLRNLTPLDQMGLATQRKLIQDGRGRLRLADVDSICHTDPASDKRLEVERLVKHLDEILNGLSDYVTERFFTHTAVARRLGDAATQ